MSSFKDFLRCYNNKDIVPKMEAMQKMTAFYQINKLDILELGSTLPNLDNFFPQNLTMQKSILSLNEKKTCFNISRKTWCADHLLSLRVTKSLTKHLLGNQPICANQLLLSVLGNSIPTQYINFATRTLHALGF